MVRIATFSLVLVAVFAAAFAVGRAVDASPPRADTVTTTMSKAHA